MTDLPRHLPYRTLLEMLILVLAVVCLAAPFLGQPFHMDDNFYMDMARNVLEKPLFPYDMPYVFEGKLVPDMGSHSHPPFQAYFLSSILYLFGEGPGKEWIYHTIGLVFPITAVIALYFLSAEYLKKPLWPALLLACSPLFLVMQHNLMTDVPNLAFWLAAIAAFFRATERHGKGAYVASSFFQSAAMFTSYQSVSLTLLLGYYHYRRRNNKNNVAGWLSLSFPVVLLGAWISVNSMHYNRFLLARTVMYVESRSGWSLTKLATKAAAAIQYQGWLIIFPLLLLFFLTRALVPFLLALGAAILVSMALFNVPEYTLPNKAIFLIGSIAGLSVVFTFVSHAFGGSSGDHGKTAGQPWQAQFLSLWYFGVLGYCMFLFADASARYLLPLLPPVLLLYCRVCEFGRWRKNAQTGGGLFLAVILSGATGLALSHADWEFASIYPQIAADLHDTAVHDSYYGGEWGFRYYLSNAGFKQWPPESKDQPSSGRLVRPALALPYGLSGSGIRARAPLQQITYGMKNPFRLIDLHSPAGFYSTHWGLLPFSVSWSSQETVEIREIQGRSDYLHLRAQLKVLTGEIIPAGKTTLVICNGDEELIQLLGPNFRHFPQAEDGTYAGFYPADGRQAVIELQKLEARGAEYMIIPQSSLWWLDYYSELKTYLDSNAATIYRSEDLAFIYRLSGKGRFPDGEKALPF